MPASAPVLLSRDPAHVQGGDLSAFAPGQIGLDLSICTNRLGPPPSAVAALQELLTERPGDLVPPPYERDAPPYTAEKMYLQAFADRLGTSVDEMLPGRGVTEFLHILARVLRGRDVAVITPDYTETCRLFSYAHFAGPPDPAKDTAGLRLERVRTALRDHQVVILSNPSNPLGHYLPAGHLLQAAREHPASLLVLDEEYIEFQGAGLSMAGADVDNVVILQSTGKTFGITGTRAGVLWTRNRPLYELVRAELISWPLSLLDITLATAALRDEAWLTTARAAVKADAQLMHELLTARFGQQVQDAAIHFRFVHLSAPGNVFEQLARHGVAVRLFQGTTHGVSGIRIMAPTGPLELAVLAAALDTLPAGRAGE
jgi:histidinol-phosphate aminotransferase